MAKTPKQAEAGATAPADAAAEQARRGPRIRVRSVSQQGRRRAGFAFGKEPVVILVSELTEDQAEAIATDPQLVVELHEGDPEPEGLAD